METLINKIVSVKGGWLVDGDGEGRREMCIVYVVSSCRSLPPFFHFNKDFVKIILTPQLFLPLQLSPRPSFNTILFETKKPPVVTGEALLESIKTKLPSLDK